jgi:hypothetical protein
MSKYFLVLQKSNNTVFHRNAHIFKNTLSNYQTDFLVKTAHRSFITIGIKTVSGYMVYWGIQQKDWQALLPQAPDFEDNQRLLFQEQVGAVQFNPTSMWSWMVLRCTYIWHYLLTFTGHCFSIKDVCVCVCVRTKAVSQVTFSRP